MLYVLPMPLHEHVRVVSSAEKADGVDRDALRGAQGWLAERLEEAGFAEGSVEALVALGDPAFEIVATATLHDSTLIVMGTRGEGLAARALPDLVTLDTAWPTQVVVTSLNSLVVGRMVASHVHADALLSAERDDQELIYRSPLLAYLSPGRYATIKESDSFPFPADFKR